MSKSVEKRLKAQGVMQEQRPVNLEERARELAESMGETFYDSAYAAKKIAALLTQVQAEARLEEAKWWDSLKSSQPFDENCLLKAERIAALAQAAAPATKEEGHE